MNQNYAIQIAVQGLIEGQEGFEATAYYDTNGYAIGYGNHYYADGSAVQQGDTITQAAAEALVEAIAGQTWTAIQPSITADLNENQAAALIDLAYNCGSGLVSKSQLVQLINSGATEDQISAQWEQTCTTANGTYLQGLYTRRVDEVGLFFANVSDAANDLVTNNQDALVVGGALIVALAAVWIWRASKKKS
jgi:lysozyme